MKKQNTHIVIKRDDIKKYLSVRQLNNLQDVLNTIMNGREKDGKNRCNKYYICNVDESYSDKVLDIIQKGGK